MQSKDIPISYIQVKPEFTHVFLCKKWRREWGYWENKTKPNPKPKQNKQQTKNQTKINKQKSPQKLQNKYFQDKYFCLISLLNIK